MTLRQRDYIVTFLAILGLFLAFSSHVRGEVSAVLLLVALGLHIVWWRCPYCGKFLGRKHGVYCRYCGRAIDRNAKISDIKREKSNKGENP